MRGVPNTIISLALAAMKATRKLDSTPYDFFDLNVGERFLINLNTQYGCNSLQSNNQKLFCPLNEIFIIDYSNQGYYDQTPDFLSFSSAQNGDLIYTGVIPNTARFGYSFLMIVNQYLCPESAQTTATCSGPPNALGTLNNLWVTDHDPDAINGTKSLKPSTSSFRLSPFIQGVVDPDNGDVLTYTTFLGHPDTGLDPNIPDWMGTDSGTGLLLGVIPSRASGIYNFTQIVTTKYNGRAIIGKDFQPTIHYSNLTAPFSFEAVNSGPIFLKQVPNITDFANKPLSFPISTSLYLREPNDDPLEISLISADGSLSALPMSYNNLDQALDGFAGSNQRQTYYLKIQACDLPGLLCDPIPACTVPAPICTQSAVFSLVINNNPPTLKSFLPSISTTIGTRVQLTNIKSRFSDIDPGDAESFSIAIQRAKEDINTLMPLGFAQDPITGDPSWKPMEGTLTDLDYLFEITADDTHGGKASGIWTVRLNSKDLVITPPSNNLISTKTGLLAHASLSPPYLNLDISRDQYDGFFNLTQFIIPTQLPNTAINFTYNSQTQRFIIDCLIPHEFPGSWPIQISHPSSNIPQETNIQAISPGTIILQPLNLVAQHSFCKFD